MPSPWTRHFGKVRTHLARPHKRTSAANAPRRRTSVGRRRNTSRELRQIPPQMFQRSGRLCTGRTNGVNSLIRSWFISSSTLTGTSSRLVPE